MSKRNSLAAYVLTTWLFVILGGLGFWGLIIWAAAHFIRKFW